MSVILARKIYVFVLFVLILTIKPVVIVNAQKIPLGYIVQYSNKCDNDNFLKDLLPEHPENWKILHLKHLQGAWVSIPDSLPETFANISKGVLSPQIFGDYIMEFEFRFYNRVSDSALFTFLGPVKSPNSFYFMDQGQLGATNNLACSVRTQQWNKVRVERNILKRRTNIIVNGDFEHKLTFTDKNLVMGYVGFGSNASCLLRNIVIYAPTSITDTPFKWF